MKRKTLTHLWCLRIGFALILHCLSFEKLAATDYNRYLAYRAALTNSTVVGKMPIVYNFFDDQSVVANAATSLLKDPLNSGLNQVDIYNGTGLLLKGNADGLPANKFVILNVVIPGTMYDVCGVVIGSKPDADNAIPSGYMFQWRTNSTMAFRTLNSQQTGSQVFPSLQNSSSGFTTYLFDSVPANEFNVAIFSQPNAGISIRLTFIHSCYFSDTIVIEDCGESIMENPRFMVLPVNTPISIKCPTNCIQKRPCWGYRVYTYDSPICWVATQNFGSLGSGLYTLYRITSPFFNDEIDPSLNNRIYCRSFKSPYPAMTFEKNIAVTVTNQYNQQYPNGTAT